MSDDIQPIDLAEQVLSANYLGTQAQWGRELRLLLDAHDEPHLLDWQRERLESSLANYVKQHKTRLEHIRQQERALAIGITPNGRLINPTISVRNEAGGRQTLLWVEATPSQFIEAVLCEQSVIDGRNQSNRLRLHVVELLQQDESLMALPTLGAVCGAVGIDPDSLGLDDLAV